MQTVLLGFEKFKDLPLAEFDGKLSPIYAIDYQWVYVYMNAAAIRRLNGVTLVGKHLSEAWKEFPAVDFRPLYILMRDPVKNRQPFNMTIKSPLSSGVVEIIGQPLLDCYFFSVTQPVDKGALIEELRTALRR